MDQTANTGNDREEFPKMIMYENLIIRNRKFISKYVVRKYSSKIVDKLVEKSESKNQPKKRRRQPSSNGIELNDRSTVEFGNRPSKKQSAKRQCLKWAKSPRRLNYLSSSESSESPGSPDSCWDTTLDSPVLTTSIEQVDNLGQSLATLVNTEPGQLTNLIGIIYQILNSANDKVFSAFHLVDESRLKVRVQIYESSINRARYARLANLEVGQVVSLQNVNFNQLKYLTISSKHETEFEIDPDNVRAEELREWFENGQNYTFETVGQKQM